jgi:hypothetical protein
LEDRRVGVRRRRARRDPLKDGKPIPKMARVSRQGQRREDFLFDFRRQRAMGSG